MTTPKDTTGKRWWEDLLESIPWLPKVGSFRLSELKGVIEKVGDESRERMRKECLDALPSKGILVCDENGSVVDLGEEIRNIK